MAKTTSLSGRMLGGGRYEIVELFGRGAFAHVYRGRQLNLDRDVAIKILNDSAASDKAVVKRFHLEAAAIAKFEHPNIIKIYDHGEDDGLHYYVMNFLPKTLRSLFQPNRPLPLDMVIQIARQLASALNYANSTVSNFVHRDIKPENVLLDDSHHAILSDFGLVRGDQITRMTVGENIIGTPTYMSPEQIQGKPLDGRSDLYSLGVLIFECATGTIPFKGEILSVCHQHVNNPPPSPRMLNPNLPPPIEELILRLLEKPAEKRLQSASALLAAIEDLPTAFLRHSASIYSQPTVPVSPPSDFTLENANTPQLSFPRRTANSSGSRPAQKRLPSLRTAALAGALLVAAFAALLYFERGQRPSLADNTNAKPLEQSKVDSITPPPAQFGSLFVGSQPEAAAILIDGRQLSKQTPVTIDSIQDGRYQLEVRYPGYRSWRDFITINAGQTTRVSPILTKLPDSAPTGVVSSGIVIVRSQPGSEVVWKNVRKPVARDGSLRLELPVGRQLIECAVGEFGSQNQWVEIAAGQSQTIRFEWLGTISVLANTASGPVYGPVFLNDEDTERLADGSAWRVPVGEYMVAVKKDGYAMIEPPPKVIVHLDEHVRVKIPMRDLK